jgi:hypothetical protein
LIDGVLDYNERAIRARIGELPEGSWSFEDQLDDDSHTPEPVPLKVTLTVQHKPKPHMTFDFTGSSEQRRGGVNVVYEALFATVAFALKATLDPGLWSNAAFERVVKLVAPEGSIVNPRPPAPVGGRGTTCQRLADLLLGAMAQIVPERVTACGHGTTSINIHGYDPSRTRAFICIDGSVGGMGARGATTAWTRCRSIRTISEPSDRDPGKRVSDSRRALRARARQRRCRPFSRRPCDAQGFPHARGHRVHRACRPPSVSPMGTRRRRARLARCTRAQPGPLQRKPAEQRRAAAL